MTAETEPQVLSIDEAIAHFPDEWIFMRVTGKDQYHTPSHGVVLAHHPKRAILQQSILAIVAPRWAKDVEYFVFFTHPRIRTREEWRRVIENQIRKGS